MAVEHSDVTDGNSEQFCRAALLRLLQLVSQSLPRITLKEPSKGQRLTDRGRLHVLAHRTTYEYFVRSGATGRRSQGAYKAHAYKQLA